MKQRPEELNNLSDAALLKRLLAHKDRLTDEEADAFSDMSDRLAVNQRKLSSRQREWAEAVYDRLDIQAEYSRNMVSSGDVKKEKVPTFWWEEHKPLKPPGR
jgi:hypothetical protein